MNDNKAKLEASKIEGLDETLLEREEESRAFHEVFLDTRQKIGILDGRIDALELELRHHCR